MNKIKIFITILICLAVIPSLVSAFGQIAGPVVIHVPLGGSNQSSWGIFNGESITVNISAEGDAMKYIFYPEVITLEPNNKIYWVNITAKIPSGYNLTQGTNITGVIYALAGGKPGQVQINLQLKKNIFILVEQEQVTTLPIEQEIRKFMTGLSALEPVYVIPVAVLGIIILFGIFYFTKMKRR